MMNDQMPPNAIVPPVLVILQSPLDRRAVAGAGSADQCRGDEREQQRIRNGGRLERQIHPERQAV